MANDCNNMNKVNLFKMSKSFTSKQKQTNKRDEENESILYWFQPHKNMQAI